MAELEKDFDATLIGIGLHGSRSTRVPGTDHPQVYSAIDLLRQISSNEAIELQKRIVVIGGGNVAFDIARSLARLQRKQFGEVNIVVTALEPRDNMLADESEVIESEEEGIQLYTSRGPRQCVRKDDTLTGLETVFCVSIFDEQGRFHPKYDDNDVLCHETDMVVEAIGQSPQLEFIGDALTEKLEWDRRGRPIINAEGKTSEAWLWAAGDVVQGPDVIHAIAAGHRVANSIHQYLS